VKKGVVVLGLGNVLLSDEGIGVHIVRRLAKTHPRSRKVKFIDFGTGGLALLHLIANRKKVVIIDCANMGDTPGTIRRFAADQVKSVKRLANFSLHQLDILRIIEMSKQLGERPDAVIFFGIQPQSLNPGRKLTKTLSTRIN